MQINILYLYVYQTYFLSLHPINDRKNGVALQKLIENKELKMFKRYPTLEDSATDSIFFFGAR